MLKKKEIKRGITTSMKTFLAIAHLTVFSTEPMKCCDEIHLLLSSVEPEFFSPATPTFHSAGVSNPWATTGTSSQPVRIRAAWQEVRGR